MHLFSSCAMITTINPSSIPSYFSLTVGGFFDTVISNNLLGMFFVGLCGEPNKKRKKRMSCFLWWCHWKRCLICLNQLTCPVVIWCTFSVFSWGQLNKTLADSWNSRRQWSLEDFRNHSPLSHCKHLHSEVKWK